MLSDKDISRLEKWRRLSPGYYGEIDRLFLSLVPPGSRVLEVGCGTGRLLSKLRPSTAVGIDMDERKVEAARQLHGDHPEIQFLCLDIERPWRLEGGPFDYIILSDLLPVLDDVQQVLTELRQVTTPATRIVMNFPSNAWRPVLRLATRLGLRQPDKKFNWLSLTDVKNLLRLSDYDIVVTGSRVLLPMRFPGVDWLMNRFLAKLPGLASLCLSVYVVARPDPALRRAAPEATVSIVVPTRNEKGNVEGLFTRTPRMGVWTELIIVDGHSTDGTREELQRCIQLYGHQWKRVVWLPQSGTGKGQAVHQGLADCRGDVLMILDSDLTMPPEELPKYYKAITSGHGELINGCRLVYPMEGEAMRFLNMVANHVFAKLFTWLLGQPIKDTLCGTKVFWRRDYDQIMANRAYFGDFDPFGDFDLLFGAAHLNRKIIDMPIRYRDRTYGDIKIHRWRHGVLLLRMSVVGFRKFKLT